MCQSEPLFISLLSAEVQDLMSPSSPRSIIFISGDRHEFAAAIIREKVLDFSISPLNQFYLPVSLFLHNFEVSQGDKRLSLSLTQIRTLSQKYGRGTTGEDRVLKCECLHCCCVIS